MAITVEDVMQMTSTQNCRVVAGHQGLRKEVRWFLGMLSPVVEPWVHKHEILFVYGNGLDTSDSALLFLLNQCEAKEVSAIFFIMGPIFREIPQVLKDRADEVKIPLVEMPDEIPVVDITRELAELIFNNRRAWSEKGNILKNFIYGHESDYEKYVKQLEAGQETVRIHEYINIVILRMEKNHVKDNSSMVGDVEQILLNVYGKSIYFWNGNHEIVLLCNNDNRSATEAYALAAEAANQYEKLMQYPIKCIGIGNTVLDIVNVVESYQNAIKALDNREDAQIICYEQMSNVKKILAEIRQDQVLKYCYQDTVGKLLEYDAQHGSSLCETLRAYLNAEGNIAKSAQTLYIHRNTMVYRINKINEILSMEMEKKNTMLELTIAFECYDKYRVLHE